MKHERALEAGPIHGSSKLPSVTVDSYNVEIRDDDGFIGDRATKSAFRELLEHENDRTRKSGKSSLGSIDARTLSKSDLDELLDSKDSAVTSLLDDAIKTFSHTLAGIIRRYLHSDDWRGTQRIVVGGGFRATRVGKRVIERTNDILQSDAAGVDLVAIRNDPDEAGLIGNVHLISSELLKTYDVMLGVDIGGSNIRAGVVKLNMLEAPDLSRARVLEFELWRHADDGEVKRKDMVEVLVEMLKALIEKSKSRGPKLAPFVGVGCPGKIEPDGSIEKGAQNLPGNWESDRFNLPELLRRAIPRIGSERTTVVMHNDAVVQGLSEAPFMRDVERWGVLTIGTGLGNARFTNR